MKKQGRKVKEITLSHFLERHALEQELKRSISAQVLSCAEGPKKCILGKNEKETQAYVMSMLMLGCL